jgi:hypothetical protein
MQNNHNQKTKYINGIKAYFIAGTWYADYNQYLHVRNQQGIRTSEDVFFSFCNLHDLCPTG